MTLSQKDRGEKTVMRGNEVIAEAAVRASCRFFAGYPITPQNEIPEYLSWRLPEVGGVFIQAESEITAINMIYGASSAGGRAMISSSSMGISLMQEGISYLAGAELPCVIVNVARVGPGIGALQATQGDYFQAVKRGGHGDYHLIVLAPASLQETADLVIEAFDMADRYRNPVMILCDAILGQMMEIIDWRKVRKSSSPEKPWALRGKQRGGKKVIHSEVYSKERIQELYRKYDEVAKNEQRYESLYFNQAKLVIVAFGTMARVVKTVVREAREEGMRVGFIRPISLWPFPIKAFAEIDSHTKAILTVEMNMGQMVEDVRLAVEKRVPVFSYGWSGGDPPSPEDVFGKIKDIYKKLRG